MGNSSATAIWSGKPTQIFKNFSVKNYEVEEESFSARLGWRKLRAVVVVAIVNDRKDLRRGKERERDEDEE